MSKIPVLIDSSPVRVVRNHVGRVNEHGTKQDFLSFHAFSRLLWRIACMAQKTEDLSESQKISKLLFRMER